MEGTLGKSNFGTGIASGIQLPGAVELLGMRPSAHIAMLERLHEAEVTDLPTPDVQQNISV